MGYYCLIFPIGAIAIFHIFVTKIGENVEFKFCNPQMALPCAKPRYMSHRALKSVQSFFPVEDGKKEKGKGRHKKSRKRCISPIRGEALRERIFTKFCTSGDSLDVIISADFGVEKLRGLGNTRGQILAFPIEMAGHPYNRTGATAQSVIHHVIFHCELFRGLFFGLSARFLNFVDVGWRSAPHHCVDDHLPTTSRTA